jgi:membrane protein DedA with SNARE-associated domain
VAFPLIETVVSLTIRVLTVVGLPGLFALMVVESFGVPPLPSEVILTFAGFLVAEGTFPLGGAVFAALAGGLVGSFLGYLVGRWGRDRITGMGIGFLRIEERHLRQMETFFARWGEVTVAVARLLPVVRGYISYPAGAARMNPVKFGVYTLIGATPFTLALLYVGFVLRAHWEVVTSYFAPFDYVAVAAIGVGVVYIALLVAGILAPGWPIHRRNASPASGRGPSATEARGRGPP